MEESKVVSNATESVSNQEQTKEDVVKYETHQKLLGQHKKTKDYVSALEQELNEFRKAQQDKEQSKLAEEGKFKEILGLKEEKLKTMEEQLADARAREENTWKLQSFYNKLPGRIKHNDYLSHAALDKIIYDHETMTCDSDSVEAVVNDFMSKHSHLVEASTKGKLPSESPNSSTKILNKIETNKSPEEAMKEKLSRLFGD